MLRRHDVKKNMRLEIILWMICFERTAEKKVNLNNRLVRLFEVLQCSDPPVTFNHGAYSCTRPRWDTCKFVVFKFNDTDACACQAADSTQCRCTQFSNMCSKIPQNDTDNGRTSTSALSPVTPPYENPRTTGSITTLDSTINRSSVKPGENTASSFCASECNCIGLTVGVASGAVLLTLFIVMVVLWICWDRIENKIGELKRVKVRTEKSGNQDYTGSTNTLNDIDYGHDACVLRENSIYSTDADGASHAQSSTSNGEHFTDISRNTNATFSETSGNYYSLINDAQQRNRPRPTSDHIYLDLLNNVTDEVKKDGQRNENDVNELAQEFEKEK